MPAKDQRGQILITLIIVVPSLILIAASYLALSVNGLKLARQDQLHTEAQITADAGADYALEQINQNGSWVGTGGEMVLHNAGSVKTTYSASVATNSASSKTLSVTGRTYSPVAASTPSATVTIKVDLRAVSSGSYSIISGEGGLVLANSAKIAGGDVFIDGTVSMTNSAQIGLSTNPVNVTVADQACPVPPDATYPSLCNANQGPQPILMSTNNKIYGTVKANNQSSGAGMTNPGLVASSGVSPQPLPTYDRSAQKAAVVSTVAGTSASCTKNTLTWGANTEITGDVSISGTCAVTVKGNVWITGNLTLANSAQLIVDNSLNTTRPNIMIDGSTGLTLNNGAQLVSNSSSTGFEIYTFWSSATCSPDCSSVTGTDLYNSRNIATINLNNASSAPQSIFYAYWSRAQVGNSGQIGALIGQTVGLNNNSTITFGTSTYTGQTFWVINGYRHTYP